MLCGHPGMSAALVYGWASWRPTSLSTQLQSLHGLLSLFTELLFKEKEGWLAGFSHLEVHPLSSCPAKLPWH